MIVLIGIPSEPPLAMVKYELDRLGAPNILFNQRKFDACDLRVKFQNGTLHGVLRIEALEVPLEKIEGAYARPMDDTQLPELGNEQAHSHRFNHCRSLHELLICWLEIAPGRMINRPSAMGSNSSKPYQAQLIRRYGFQIPETLISNDPDEVLAFWQCHGRLIYKSISGVRSIVMEMTPDMVDRLGFIRWCPTQFQQYVQGFDVRVHTIGHQVFATKAHSTATDYRYSGRQGSDMKLEPYQLPSQWEQRCLELSHGIGLAFAGIDLKITPEGEVYCFEVNPCPAYSFYEQNTGQPIAAAVAGYLAGRNGRE